MALTTAIQNLSQRQIMLSLAYMAYCGEDITSIQSESPESTILSAINTAIPQISPVKNWKVVWGPVVYTTPGSLYQDNMMYVAQNQADTSQFAIAIRGTNSVSDLDWLMDDFDILQTMPWSSISPNTSSTGTFISESTSIGISTLLGMTSSVTGSGTLLNFLNSQTANPIWLCVTGHSLGGCLAGTLALYLTENVSTWDQSNKSNVSCITFAAPTAGNAAFATYSDGVFNNSSGSYPPNWDKSLGTTFDAVRCSLDIAPMCWIADNIATTTNGNTSSPIFSAYVPGIDFTNMTFGDSMAWSTVILPYLLPDVAGGITGDYTQTVASAAMLQGTINPDFTISDKDIEETLATFVNQATYQHSGSYPIILSVPELTNASIIQLDPSSSSAQAKPTPHLDLLIKLAGNISRATAISQAERLPTAVNAL